MISPASFGAALRPAALVGAMFALAGALPAASASTSASGKAATVTEWRRACAGKDGWSDPAPPLRIYGNTYDVGTCGITALLIASPQGHVLLDAATDEAAPSIAANIRRLGFRLSDVKLIGSSHEHLDHVGGLSALQKLTGAKVMALPAARRTLQTGVIPAADPQAGLHEPFPGVQVTRSLRDGERVRVGPLAITVHATSGHAPGSTSWSWVSCEANHCLRMVYADSVTAVSSATYRFSAHPAAIATFRRSLRKIGALPCDLLITPHPSASNLIPRLAGEAPLADPQACRAYAERGLRALDERLAREQGSSRP